MKLKKCIICKKEIESADNENYTMKGGSLKLDCGFGSQFDMCFPDDAKLDNYKNINEIEFRMQQIANTDHVWTYICDSCIIENIDSFEGENEIIPKTTKVFEQK